MAINYETPVYNYGNTDFRSPQQMFRDHQLEVAQNNTRNLGWWNADQGLALKEAQRKVNAATGGIGRDVYDYSNVPTTYAYPAPAPSAILPGRALASAVSAKPVAARTPSGPVVMGPSYDYDKRVIVGASGRGNAGITPERQAVMDQQRFLNDKIGAGLKVDGVVGPNTLKAMDMYRAREASDQLKADEAMMNAPAAQVVTAATTAPKQQGWKLNQEATDRMYQQWANNELDEGQVPTAVYDAPEGGLAAKFASWFK